MPRLELTRRKFLVVAGTLAAGAFAPRRSAAQAAAPLAVALEATWRRDPSLYYEDGYQEFADRGGVIGTAPIGAVDWVEVDNHDDLARAREIACHY